MADIAIVLAKIISEEVLLDILIDSLREYRATPNDETKKRMTTALGLTSLKFASEKMTLSETSAEIDQIAKIREMFKSTN